MGQDYNQSDLLQINAFAWILGAYYPLVPLRPAALPQRNILTFGPVSICIYFPSCERTLVSLGMNDDPMLDS